MLIGSCHCGAVQIQVARKPRRLTSCNCSICRRHAGLWGYYELRDALAAHQSRRTQDGGQFPQLRSVRDRVNPDPETGRCKDLEVSGLNGARCPRRRMCGP